MLTVQVPAPTPVQPAPRAPSTMPVATPPPPPPAPPVFQPLPSLSVVMPWRPQRLRQPVQQGRRGPVRRYSHERAAFVKAGSQLPADPGPHLTLADLLDEQGQTAGAEVIRRAVDSRVPANRSGMVPHPSDALVGRVHFNVPMYYGTSLVGDDSNDHFAAHFDRPETWTPFGGRRRRVPGRLTLMFWPHVQGGVPGWGEPQGYYREHPVMYTAHYPLEWAHHLVRHLGGDRGASLAAYLQRYKIRPPRKEGPLLADFNGAAHSITREGRIVRLGRRGPVRRHHHLAFLGKIQENPDDMNRSQAYADWLEEQGDPLGVIIRHAKRPMIGSNEFASRGPLAPGEQTWALYGGDEGNYFGQVTAHLGLPNGWVAS